MIQTIVYPEEGLSSSSNEKCQHQPILGFKSKDPFLYDTTDLQYQRRQGQLPDIITQATLEYFYTS